MHNRNSSSDTSMIFAIIAIGLGVIGLILPSTTGFLKQQDIVNVCSQSNTIPPTSSADNCANTLCPTLTTQSNVPTTYFCTSFSRSCHLYLQKTTMFTTSSTIFVSVTGMSGANWSNENGTPCTPGFAWCIVTFNFNINSLTGNAQFKMRDTTFNIDSNIYQEDASASAVVSSDTIGSIVWLAGSSIIGDTIAFQVKVSVGTITLSIIKADMLCYSTNGEPQSVG